MLGKDADDDGNAAHGRLAELKQRFFQALDDDMNTSAALSILFEIAADCRALSKTGAASALAAFMHQGLELLGISPVQRRTDGPCLADDLLDRLQASLQQIDGDGVPTLDSSATPESAIEQVVAARSAARVAKNFPLSDRLRASLAHVGILVKDDPSGSSWSIEG